MKHPLLQCAAVFVAILSLNLLSRGVCSAAGVITADFTIDYTSYKQSPGTEERAERSHSMTGRVQMLDSRAAWRLEFRRVANSSRLYAYTNGAVAAYTTIIEEDSSLWGRYGGAPVIAPASSEGGPIGIEIDAGSLPLSGLWQATLAWFVWCSGEHLSVTNRLLPDLLANVREDRLSLGFRDVTTRYSDWLGAPVEMIQYYDHDLIRKSVVHDWMPRANISVAKYATGEPGLWVKQGQKRAEFKVLSTRSVLGANWPTEFLYVAYKPSTQGIATVLAKVHGSVSALSTNEPMEFPVELKRHTSFAVVDHRFRHPSRTVDYLHYAQTNFGVLPTNSSKLLEVYSKSVQEAPLDHYHKRLLAFQLIATTSVLWIGGMALWKWRRKAHRIQLAP